MKIIRFLAPVLFAVCLTACGVNEPDTPDVRITGCNSISIDGHNIGSIPHGAISFNTSGSSSKGSFNYHVVLTWSAGCIKTASATKN